MARVDFDSLTDETPGPHDDCVQTFPVEVREDGIYVGFSEKNPTNERCPALLRRRSSTGVSDRSGASPATRTWDWPTHSAGSPREGILPTTASDTRTPPSRRRRTGSSPAVRRLVSPIPARGEEHAHGPVRRQGRPLGSDRTNRAGRLTGAQDGQLSRSRPRGRLQRRHRVRGDGAPGRPARRTRDMGREDGHPRNRGLAPDLPRRNPDPVRRGRRPRRP